MRRRRRENNKNEEEEEEEKEEEVDCLQSVFSADSFVVNKPSVSPETE